MVVSGEGGGGGDENMIKGYNWSELVPKVPKLSCKDIWITKS